ncbi:hypothetical protein D9M68_965540 [compost metagenome]
MKVSSEWMSKPGEAVSPCRLASGFMSESGAKANWISCWSSTPYAFRICQALPGMGASVRVTTRNVAFMRLANWAENSKAVPTPPNRLSEPMLSVTRLTRGSEGCGMT